MDFTGFDKFLHKPVKGTDFIKKYKVDKFHTCWFISGRNKLKSRINFWSSTVQVYYDQKWRNLYISKEGKYYLMYENLGKEIIQKGNIECSTSQATPLDNLLKNLNVFGTISDLKYLKSLQCSYSSTY